MRTIRRMLRAISSLLLVAAIGWTQPSVVVLCIAPGGHIAIEPGQERCAARSDVAERGEGPCITDLARAEACCPPCADLPLGSSLFIRATGPRAHVEQLHAAATLAWVAGPPASAPPVLDGSILAYAAGCSLSETPLQTVVLRC
jgi:hypothetical protein